MRDLIEEVDWDDILSPLNIHCAWKLFTKKFTAFIDECIPQDIPRKKNIFMNHSAINLRNRKWKLWNKYIRSKSPDDYSCSITTTVYTCLVIQGIDLTTSVKLIHSEFFNALF